MRIVHLSDIHLNNKNIEDLKNYYLESLIEDLTNFSHEKKIDLILITGDLVDKGGNSLGPEPYKLFKENIIQPLSEKLNLPTNRFLIIPGNHDINQEFIKVDNEFYLSEKLDCKSANQYVDDLKNEIKDENKRIEQFKIFEKELHSSTENYSFSNMHSLFIWDNKEFKIGFALLNDSWRCSADLKRDQHYIGHSQLLKARNFFVEEKTDLNLAIFHHPLPSLNGDEQAEIKNILKTKNFDIAIFGHNHKYEAERLVSEYGGYLSINGRSAFSNPSEISSIYQPGYNLLDLDPSDKTYKISARKFIKSSGYRFDKDTDSVPNGEESGLLPQNERLYALAEDTNNEDENLPGSYTADVDRIVGLLIGESIYPDKYAFTRELVQNSVDACNRVIETNSHASPRIIITIDPESNFIEVYDEGDGMTKNVIKNHFAVIGKSISQDHNDNTQRSNLISKFGIGFISTFIAAEKVVINTKTEEDGSIKFEIEDVFKGFKYFNNSQNELESKSGTSIRVYLKKGFDINTASSTIRRYCRHVNNLEIKHGDSVLKIEERWNMEDSSFFHTVENDRYVLKLGLNNSTKGLYASYCGFFISTHNSAILPFRFPSHIVGEINFKPKSIDFDISRTKIISTDKSQAIQREISLALRKLFRDCLESINEPMYQIVVNYLQFYLQNYDQLKPLFDKSYQDFYSKKELISLCREYTIVEYKNQKLSLSEVFTKLKSQNIDNIFNINSNVISDFQKIIIQYLQSKGHFIFKNTNFTVSFHDVSQQTVDLNTVIQIICKERSIPCLGISSLDNSILSEMKMNKKQFPEILQDLIVEIENEYSIQIEVGRFSNVNKASVNNGNTYYLNYDHQTFQSLIKKSDSDMSDNFKIYLLGIIGLDLKD
jgi:HSP90 family molecular chaperone/predicted phosphodiesterase